MIRHLKIALACILCIQTALKAQQNSIAIKAKLDVTKDALTIQQKTVFYNTSKDTLQEIYLHNWANSFKDRETPLSKRFMEDYNRSLYFADTSELGFSEIKNLTIDFDEVKFSNVKNQADIIKILLHKKLSPNDSAIINSTYKIKLPKERFTGYGVTANGYHLRYWHLLPAIYKNSKWVLMSNLNLNDLYQEATDYSIQLDIPKPYVLESNLYQYKTDKGDFNEYFIVGKNKTDVILNISRDSKFRTFTTDDVIIKTDIYKNQISYELTTNLLARELLFLEKYLGKYPHKQILIDEATQRKNPIYGLNQLPKYLSPFPDNFKWDLTMFKALSKKYIENNILTNKRKDYWLTDGLQTYLMMEYVKEYYPEIKLLGKVSDFWGIRNFNFAKIDFNDKYPFVYQFSARKFLDQPLTMRADSLSNFNRKIANKYKAGLGLRYLAGYIGDSTLNKSIKQFYREEQLKITNSNKFGNLLAKNATKDLKWFFGDYINTSKKIDYTINKAKIVGDSIVVEIKNKRNITAPVALYGVNDKEIKFKKWFTGIDSTKTVKIAKNGFNRLSLNYENLYPEYNTLDNWKSIKKGIFNKPLQFKLFKDIEDPYYNQLYYQPEIRYNFYDGVILGAKLHNRPIIERNFEFSITPSYGTKSNSFTGSFFTRYNHYFEDSSIYRIIYGLGGSNLHYAPELAYNTFVPYVSIEFTRNTLRDVGGKFLTFRLVDINKEVVPGAVQTEEDTYSVFNVRYIYSKPNVIKGIQYRINGEYSKEFSKVYGDIRYRKLTGPRRRMELRLFAGAFLHNNTNSDYFSFGLDRANDYLFQLNYFGRSEASGIFSQQFILAEGGFKSVLDTRFANQYMLTFNSSIGVWRWLEVYNDVAFLKNRGQNLFFGYENGVRFNFVPNIFELYFPIYSNNGWEIAQPNYDEKIRFVLTANINAIYNFIRRGFL